MRLFFVVLEVVVVENKISLVKKKSDFQKPKKKEGFLKLISIFSFTGIALGVAILIIVMSVMNGFRSELVNKIIGFNSHVVIQSQNEKLKNED